jgi:serine/threonine-protein kinase
MGRDEWTTPGEGASGRCTGNWQAVEIVSETAMSCVWRAQHARCPSFSAAVKRPTSGDPELCDRFARECHITIKLGQITPHAPRVYDFGHDEEGPYLVTEWLPGRTLAALLAARGPLALRPTSRILVQVAAGLRVAHAEDIVHRDIKPHNVMMVPLGDGQSRAVLLDWGISKQLRPGGAPMPTMVAGTPHFLSPEVVDAQPIDRRADLWSLSVLLYHAVSGVLPFGGADEHLVLRAVREGDVVPPSAVLPRLHVLDEFFQRAFAADVGLRFQSVDELEDAFLAASRQRRSLPPARRSDPPSQDPSRAVGVEASFLGRAATELMPTLPSPGLHRKESRG